MNWKTIGWALAAIFLIVLFKSKPDKSQDEWERIEGVSPMVVEDQDKPIASVLGEFD